ncbi:MAG: hypothetical protein ACOCWT_05925, partial [Desulfohalobiaceae bacterium]
MGQVLGELPVTLQADPGLLEILDYLQLAARIDSSKYRRFDNPAIAFFAFDKVFIKIFAADNRIILVGDIQPLGDIERGRRV